MSKSRAMKAHEYGVVPDEPNPLAPDWEQLRQVAAMPLEPTPCVHNTLVHICRALVETRGQ